MKTIKRIILDIKRGEEIDVYLTLLFALTITILTLSGYDLTKYINSLTIAILTLLTFSILKSRHQISELSSLTNLKTNKILLKDWSNREVQERLRETKEALIIGPILHRTVKNHYAIFEELLNNNVSLRFLLVNPKDIVADIIASRPYANVNIERVKTEIASSLSSLKNLEKETSGKIHIKTIDYPLSFGGFFFDVNDHKGVIYMRFYPFKMREDDRPRLILNPTDEYWFNYFRQQAEVLWDNGNDLNE